MPKDQTPSLAQLRDIHLPEPVSWWPLAPGWLLVFFSLIILIFLGIYLLHRHYKNNRPKRQALKLLSQYYQQYKENNNTHRTSARLSELLRRVALAYYPRDRVAGLQGEEWIEFLNNTVKDINFNEVKELLLEHPYQHETQTSLEPLFSYVNAWIKQRGKPCLN